MDSNGSNGFNNDNLLGGLGGLGGLGLSAYGTSTSSAQPLLLQSANQLWFNQKDVFLDGWQFSHCRFDRCRIFVNSQHFELINCLIDEYSTIYYQGNTENIIKLFNSRYSLPFLPPQFQAIRNVDGTISIVRSS
ncbi:TPA: hypothetical protein LTW63_003433 [Enterobacter hormaechei]|nr:hypothetical protein [Enterobacter hormaechei]HBL8874462.1 hypothetical protein [Enterobacter hormaechei]HBL8901456.1 hypothetical protein [Enterobacter hormaechei]HBL8914948.1 hypothetical protein [Enterobacter hormaechei]HBL8942835.1 hypothetical protein [Enterobacter hormaechei]